MNNEDVRSALKKWADSVEEGEYLKYSSRTTCRDGTESNLWYVAKLIETTSSSDKYMMIERQIFYDADGIETKREEKRVSDSKTCYFDAKELDNELRRCS